MLWIGFSLAIGLLLVVSRRNLALGMGLAALALGAFTMSFGGIAEALWKTFSDPSVLLLTLIVAVIPVIGGTLERSGEMDRLVRNLRIGSRPFLALSPALLGMLPMPGGALLSAPMVERGAATTAPDVKAAANVWFRHVLLLIYPLGPALIASAKIAGLDVYAVIPYLVPAFALSVGLGIVFLLRRAAGREPTDAPFSLAGLLTPLAIILIAPAIDLVLQSTVSLPVSEISTAIGVCVSLVFALAVGRQRPTDMRQTVRSMRPWKYALIVLAMFAFLNVFTASGAPERIATMALPPVVLCVLIGFVLGLVTGRIQAPMSIVVPIFLSAYGALSPAGFAVTYFAVFLGYILTPIHPCISVSIEYFGTSMGPFLRRLALPAAVGLIASFVVGWFVL